MEKKWRRDHNDRMRLAWQIASLVRTDKPPSDINKTLLEVDPPPIKSKKERQRQSMEEMKRAVFLLTVANGGKVGPKVMTRKLLN